MDKYLIISNTNIPIMVVINNIIVKFTNGNPDNSHKIPPVHTHTQYNMKNTGHRGRAPSKVAPRSDGG